MNFTENIINLTKIFFPSLETKCTHSKIQPDIEQAYCPDCGKLIQNEWYVTRCRCCGVKMKAMVKNGQIIPQNHYRSHTYMDALAIYALQKLWRIYYYSSAHFFGEFSLQGNMDVDPAHFEPLLLDCFSTSKLKIISAGSEGDRNDKINFIADNEFAQKYLHVCTRKETNCGMCEKCLRTLLALDAANKLENFRAAFDIDAYEENRGNAYLFLYEKFILQGNSFYGKTYEILSRRHKDFFDSIDAQVKSKLNK